ncbi:hypothetical protein PG994_000025 [Apiospora phragmitis]|uniref:SMP domain-containing protein n=1 Tax=Apiospora phragmitis TaxID=2905665 RepID=A0ABR1X536_9PEZI
MPNNYSSSNQSNSSKMATQPSRDASRRAQAQAAGRRGAIAGVLDGTSRRGAIAGVLDGARGSLNYGGGPTNSGSASKSGTK